ncbi:MAG: circadian clock protein KaiC [Candidatus Omnitrophica bacterium]|nr:circadian clock protein KaiC [Candidatus Omnitrophota bacterium]
MAKLKSSSGGKYRTLPKVSTGIQGLDEVTLGGLPKGRPTLVCGGAGCGKTVLAMEFLCRGGIQYNEPGVFMAFEEKEKDLADNFASLGFDIPALVKDKKLAIDYVKIERNEIEETGEYDLEGLFVRLLSAIDSIGAKRVVLDTIEALFSGFTNQSILRAELRRIFGWLKDKGITAIITGEKGEHMLTKHGLEEYVADCVIYLDHRVNEQLATRRMKIIKYRGSRHGTSEFPFLIGDAGISVFPITSLLLTCRAYQDRVSSGIKQLDEMLDGKGYYRGTAVLLSGSAGSGKTSVAAQFADSMCEGGKKAIFFSFEESEGQILRNMKSIGLDLQKWIDKGQLKFISNRGSFCGLEAHLVLAHQALDDFRPDAIVMDPITTLLQSGTLDEAKAMIARLLDFAKNNGMTIVATDLTLKGNRGETTEIGISSLCDVWIKLTMEQEGRRKQRLLNILKARGMKHSHEVRNLVISDRGLSIEDIAEYAPSHIETADAPQFTAGGAK